MNNRFAKTYGGKYSAVLSSILLTLAPPLSASTDGENKSTEHTYSIESKVSDLLSNEKAKIIVYKYFPKLANSSHLSMVGAMSLHDLAAFPQAGLNDDKLKAIQAELTTIPMQ